MTLLLECPKSWILTTRNAGHNVEQSEFTFIAGMQNSIATLEDSLMISYKTKHTLTMW